MRRVSWALLAVVLGVALVAGAGDDGSPPTDEERAFHIAEGLRCPTCRSQSAAESDAPAARAMVEEITRRVREGESAARIRAFFVDRYTGDVLLEPRRSGAGLIVWALPVVAVGSAVVGLMLAFRRWRPRGRRVTDDDRSRVEGALQS